jgi:predicted transport protein
MLRYKSDFIIEYNESSSPNLRRSDIDWTQSRIIFIAPEFTKYQRNAIGFKDFAIELWEVHKYSNGMLVFNEVKPPTIVKESIGAIAKTSPAAKKVIEEIKVYTEDDHLSRVHENVKEIYTELKSSILMLGNDIEIRSKKYYVTFRRKYGFVGIVFLSSKLKAYLNIELTQLNDPLKKARDVKDIGHYSHGNTEIVISNRVEIPYAVSIIKQAYERN